MLRAGAKVDKTHYLTRVRGRDQWCMLSRSLGHFGNQAILSRPEVVQFRPVPGDKIVLATDGVWDHVSQPRAAQILQTSASEDEACERILAVVRQAQGVRDNATCVVHFVERRRWCT